MPIRPCALLVRDGRLLTMGYGQEGGLRYNLPGGNPEAGEEPRQCLERELAEELGIQCQPGDLLLVGETMVQGRQALHLVFHAPLWLGEPVLQPGQTTAHSLAWLDPEGLQTVHLYPAIGKILGRWLKEGGLPRCYLGRIHQPWLD